MTQIMLSFPFSTQNGQKCHFCLVGFMNIIHLEGNYLQDLGTVWNYV